MDTPSSQFNALDEDFDRIAAEVPQRLLDNPSDFDIYNTHTDNTLDAIAVNMPQHLLDANYYYTTTSKVLTTFNFIYHWAILINQDYIM